MVVAESPVMEQKGSVPRPVIFLVCGPSGAGKDSLLDAARGALEAEIKDGSVCFLRRCVTRAPELCSATEDSISTEQFDEDEASGKHALSWGAHGTTKYAIRNADLLPMLEIGARCVLNVSRTSVDECEKMFGHRADVIALNVTASEKTLLKRILGRGRESPEEAEKRIKRAKMVELKGDNVIQVCNEGALADALNIFIRAVLGKLEYSLWLLPDSSSQWAKAASKVIGDLAEERGTTGFVPHLVLGSSFSASQQTAHLLASEAAIAIRKSWCYEMPTAAANGIFVARKSGFDSAGVRFDVSAGTKLMDLKNIAHSIITDAGLQYSSNSNSSSDFAPFVSLLNDNLSGVSDEQLESLEAKIVSAASLVDNDFDFSKPSPVVFSDLVVVMTTGSQSSCWNEVARFPLEKQVPLPSTDDAAISVSNVE